MSYNVEEISDAMTEGLKRNLESIINKRKDLDGYYILVHSKPNPAYVGRIDTRFILMRQKPPALVGTMCFYVNNREGRLDVEWFMPHLSGPSYRESSVREWAVESARKFWQGML